MKWTVSAFAALCLWSCALVSTVAAGVCGDDVGGTRVACACGDVVVSSTVLQASDPVVGARCPVDGLTVRAPLLAETITLDLAGLALRGSGAGVGITVEHGGSDGAIVRGGPEGKHGEIVGFGTGMLVVPTNGVRRVERLHVAGSRRDGLSVRSNGAMLIDVTANDNGGDGLSIKGRGGRFTGIEARRNHQAGARINSPGAIVSGNFSDNEGPGVIAAGRYSDLRGVVARDNGGHGVIARGEAVKTEGMVAEGNGGGRIKRAGRVEP
jgi:hypothetical protein